MGMRVAFFLSVVLCGGLMLADVTATAAPAPSLQTISKILHGTTFTDTGGQQHTLSQYRGKLLLVNFWATWCGPCQKEIPVLKSAQKRLGSKGFQIIAPAVDYPASVRQDAPVLGLNYPAMVSSFNGMKALMESVEGQDGLPFSIFVAPDGHVVATHAGPLDTETINALAKKYLPQQSHMQAQRISYSRQAN